MEFNGVILEDTYAEGFPVWVARVVITAVTKEWAYKAATEATGFATSTIGCPCEAGIEKFLPPAETPDNRPGFSILICCSKKALKEQVLERVSECVLTAPTTAVFNGKAGSEEIIPIKLHFFGDGYESKVEVGGIQCWSIPIMGGDFIVEEEIGAVKGVAGGNFLIMGDSQMSALIAAQAAVDAIKGVPGTITPFPGGVVSSGSKVGSKKYKFMGASTNEKFCPTIREKVEETEIPENVKAVYEIVIDGVDEASVMAAMKAGVQAACRVPGVVKITAGNYGGNLGPFKFHLKDCL
ncbi:MAG TPA: formylmethanofuran--tetrahydromethanopterin N-formyltransferase [Methanocorpusculum sp.]|nr:formylmethanofuran--tetrahydromethanopterin N-formyltransferase [Candidatus Methanocorpusculum faecipullorum]HJK05499.1 formylmethanofuran--tetrahydromethanopterin N-formyltransferase [Methanocorpusculum sp.]HJK06097.1 formylmethanofuran--tetrahydromethanopterin N-formyltransferase [Methanocorpusculum sp.]HJK07672.1 formylmethanofuran--tetrahydromethanopterin N-formyltransferase [Methanocorpusculum sp.]HJK10425.1 formylmethanofuran--tetrahydromethanopterin N-formyltransferase [Methanocorpusc